MNSDFLLVICSFFFVLVLPSSSRAEEDASAINACIAWNSVKADDLQTVGALRQECERMTVTRVEKRRAYEQTSSLNPFSILPHKPNYLLPATYFEANEKPYGNQLQGHHFDNAETKFQVSIKYLALEDLSIDGLDMYFAFTATSWWQSYNGDISAPFRETNYEPELIFNYNKPRVLGGVAVVNRAISFSHQSNGQAGALSRSWNRLIGRVSIAQNKNVWSVKAWWRFPEDKKEIINGVAEPGGDDNPNIEKYMGYGEFSLLRQGHRGQHISMLLRNNLRTDNKGAVLVGWSFPLNSQLLGYIEYFNGYGESLIYYNQSIERFGFGIKLTDWL